MKAKGSTFRGALLVAGTSIGGGMLALPVLTSLGGFIPSLVIFFLCWLFMTCTGLLFLEVSLWMHGESNIVSMANKTLGKPGKIFAWIVYLFLFYCLTLAYVVGCGDLVSQLFQGRVSEWVGSLIFILLFGPFVFAGAHIVGKLNIYLMLGLGVFYFAFVFLGYPYVKTDLLLYRDWGLSLKALPIAFTAFAYQGIIPTLANYMHYDVKRVRLAIIIGTLLPFGAYIIWQWLILGIVPAFGAGSLNEALQNGQNAVQPLKYFLQSPSVYVVGQFFAFFALITSFFGVTLGLFDFLADGLSIKKTPKGKLLLCFLIFLPPLLIALVYPGIFIPALDFAGGYGCALLLGLLPILMVWSGRYFLGYKSTYALPGGKIVLSLLIVFVLFELSIEISHLFTK